MSTKTVHMEEDLCMGRPFDVQRSMPQAVGSPCASSARPGFLTPPASPLGRMAVRSGEGLRTPSPSRHGCFSPCASSPARTTPMLLPNGLRPRPNHGVGAGSREQDDPPSWCLPGAPTRRGAPSLSDAIKRNQVSVLRRVLEDDPWAARTPLPDSQAQPVLAAVRCCCSPLLLAELLRAGAPPDEVDSVGLTALQTVSQVASVERSSYPELSAGKTLQMPTWTEMYRIPGVEQRICSTQANEEHCCAIAVTLLVAGADPDRRDARGLDCAAHAERNGRHKLADLLRHWGGKEVAALRILRQAPLRGPHHEGPRADESETQGCATFLHLQCVFERVCDMLAPNTVYASAIEGAAPRHGQ